MNLPHLAERLFNVPLAIRPEKAEVIMAALADRFGVAHLFRIAGQDGRPVMLAFEDLEDEGGEPMAERYYDVIEGIAVIPVQGTLVQRLGSMRPWSGMTGYNAIRYNFLQALADPEVRAIALDIDSPGGEVAGCFDLADTIFRARGEKPIWAILGECACSAAYAIASAADHITVPRTGYAGSIGVITLHVDISRMLDKEGITVTLITYGARKAEGAETAPLSKGALKRIQADIDAVGELFVGTVARNRSLSANKVRDQEAGVYLGPAGVTAGLADAVMPPDEAFRNLFNSLERGSTP